VLTHNFSRLRDHILAISQSPDFDIARTEWDLIAVEISEEWDNCPCGQEIKEHCYIANRLTGHQTYVGNVCINRFIGISTGTLFDGLRRIAKDAEAGPNIAVIQYAWERGFLFGENEYRFLLSTVRKRKLSERQAAWRSKINKRILNQTVVKQRTQR
jgi:hypothetical protein